MIENNDLGNAQSISVLHDVHNTFLERSSYG